jgi:hypothetical protein
MSSKSVRSQAVCEECVNDWRNYGVRNDSFCPTRRSCGVTRFEEDRKMQTAVSRHESGTRHSHGIVYRTVCRNPWHVRTANGMAVNLNHKGASTKTSSPPSYCSVRPELARRNSKARIRFTRSGVATPQGTSLACTAVCHCQLVERLTTRDSRDGRRGYRVGDIFEKTK